MRKSGYEDERNVLHFVLWWKGEPIHIKLEREAEGLNAVHVTSTWHLLRMTLRVELEPERGFVLQNLKEALSAYKVTGTGVAVASYDAKF